MKSGTSSCFICCRKTLWWLQTLCTKPWWCLPILLVVRSLCLYSALLGLHFSPHNVTQLHPHPNGNSVNSEPHVKYLFLYQQVMKWHTAAHETLSPKRSIPYYNLAFACLKGTVLFLYSHKTTQRQQTWCRLYFSSSWMCWSTEPEEQ